MPSSPTKLHLRDVSQMASAHDDSVSDADRYTLERAALGLADPADAKFELVHAFSADPSVLGFAETFCDPATHLGRFCRAVLYECVVLEKPAMLHTHLFLYATLLAFKVSSLQPTNTNVHNKRCEGPGP